MLNTSAGYLSLRRCAVEGAARMAGIRGLVLGCIGGIGPGRHSLFQVGISRRTFVYVGATLSSDLSATCRRLGYMTIAHGAAWLSPA